MVHPFYTPMWMVVWGPRLPEMGFHLSGRGATDLVRVSIGTSVVYSNVAVSVKSSCFPE